MEHGYEDRVVFLGRQDQQTINQWLNVSDIYLHAAHLEPFGLAPQEAASTGIPVVMSMNAGACDVLKNNQHVLHTDPKKPVDIAKQVGRLLSNPHLATRCAQQAVETIQATCTWEARASDLDSFAHEAEEIYLPQRVQANLVPISDESKNTAAVRALLFQQSDNAVPDGLKEDYREVRGVVENLLALAPDHRGQTPDISHADLFSQPQRERAVA